VKRWIIDVEFGRRGCLSKEVSPSRQKIPDEFPLKELVRLSYQTNNFFLPQIRDMIEKARSYQSSGPEYKTSKMVRMHKNPKLIESLLLNIPRSAVFFYEG